MASTNKTTNYELSQFIETDRPAWLTDYNGDMRTIDSTMKAISDVASGASGSISELADRMSTAEGNIATNANDIDALEARADSLEAQAQSTAGTIANIQTEQTAQNLGIEAATELGYNLARPYDSASTYAVGAYVLFQNTLYKCITAVPTGEAFDPTKWLAIKATDEIADGGYTLPIASASQLGGVKIGSGLSIDGNGVLSAGGGALTHVTFTGTSGDMPFELVDTQLNIYSHNLTTPTNNTLHAQNAHIEAAQIDAWYNDNIAIIAIRIDVLFGDVTLGNNESFIAKVGAAADLNTNYTSYNDLNTLLQSLNEISYLPMDALTVSENFRNTITLLRNNSRFSINGEYFVYPTMTNGGSVISYTTGSCCILANRVTT